MKYSRIAVAAIAAVCLTGCASIVSKSSYPVAFKSNPSSVVFSIYDQNGALIHEGTTPETVTLSSKGGYFKSHTYKVEYSLEGLASQTMELKSSMDGWYFGNLLFGGLIGLLFVDPATGAMYKLPDEIVANMKSETASYDKAFKLATTDSLPESLVNQLQRIN